MSSKEVLSEGELDALMESVSSGEVPLQDPGDGATCRPFDFTTREQSLLAQMPALDSITEKHAAGLVQGIRELFRIPVEVAARDVTLVRLGEAFVAVPEPSAINLVKALPLNGLSFLMIPGELLSLLVDQYFGGSSQGKRQRHPGNDLTPTERRINEVVATRFMLALQAAWSDKLSLSAELVGTESNPDFMQLGAADEWAVKFSFELQVFDTQALIDWVVPYALLEPVRAKLGSLPPSLPIRQGGDDWEQAICRELPAVELEISALFTSSQVNIARILGLKKGAILPLKAPSQVTICVEGQPFCRGEHGAFNGKKSVKITQLLAPGAELE